MRRCRPRKPSPEVVQHRSNRAEYFEGLRALRGEQQEQPTQRQIDARVDCCAKATIQDCACGGARICPVHGGPVCFGKFSHD
ncbi:hypothetical protein HMI49_04085 [Corallococcus exercitus]|uniref:Uncharacterized protein n=1 Tax=Corallococcus exercitus TaxID=2316736 RepID=A0A7Y4NPI0_9BACT|nr:hypothetical protein [Corallococcus exercitus]NOK32379.1 hypothetical protein [Corallococcus exercitus]